MIISPAMMDSAGIVFSGGRDELYIPLAGHGSAGARRGPFISRPRRENYTPPDTEPRAQRQIIAIGTQRRGQRPSIPGRWRDQTPRQRLGAFRSDRLSVSVPETSTARLFTALDKRSTAALKFGLARAACREVGRRPDLAG